MAKMTKKGRSFVSDEISHLMKEGPSKGPQKGEQMPQKQAVAVALDVARRKGFKTAPKAESSDGLQETGLIKRVMTAYGSAKKAGGTPSQAIAHGIVGALPGKTTNIRRQMRRSWQSGTTQPSTTHEPITSGHPLNTIPKPTMVPKPPKPVPHDPMPTMMGGRVINPYHPHYKPEEHSMFDNLIRESGGSIFDALVERELPESFKKNMGKFTSKSSEKEDENENEEDENEEDENEEKETDESVSLFDGLVQESRGSIFDELTSKGVDEDQMSWDDRVARTMTLAENLVEIRNTIKRK